MDSGHLPINSNASAFFASTYLPSKWGCKGDVKNFGKAIAVNSHVTTVVVI